MARPNIARRLALVAPCPQSGGKERRVVEIMGGKACRARRLRPRRPTGHRAMNNRYRVYCHDGQEWRLDQVFAAEQHAHHWASMRRRHGKLARVDGPPVRRPPTVEPVKQRPGKGLKQGWNNAVKTKCRNGHDYSPENTRVATRSNGRQERICRTCNRAIQARSRLKRKLAAT